VQIGKNFFAAVAGTALVISNKKEVLKLALDMQGKGGKSLANSAALAEAARALPEAPLAKLWINLEPAHQSLVGKLYTRHRAKFLS